MRVLVLALLGGGLAMAGCIIQAPTSEGTQSSAPRPAAAPPAEVPNGANFGDKVELTSAIINPSRAFAGDSVRVTLNLKVLDGFDRDYMIFVHVEDVEGRVDRLNVDHAPRLKPTSAWQKGETVRDEFEVPIPPGMPVRGLNVVLGFWDPKTDQRLAIKNKEAVRNDGHDRLFVATIPVAQP